MAVLRCDDVKLDALQQLLSRYGISIEPVDSTQAIPGSWFGTPEAGLIENRLYVRADTPVHSALHESCHYICMDPSRRARLHTDAGGGYEEENGVCYLSILLSDFIEGFSRQRMFKDMDEWGYTFRLGSSQAWFEQDAEDAVLWLQDYGLVDQRLRPTWRIRDRD